MARARLLPLRIRQRIAQSKNVVNLNEIDDMLLNSPEEDIRDDEGIWKLQRKCYKDGYTQLFVSQMEWKNIAENEAIVPECCTDPEKLEKMRREEPLREDLIEHPLAEEQTRRQKARGLWTQKKTSKLCATLAKTNYQFGQTSEKMKMSRGDCVEHWYSYKRDKQHLVQCQSCNTQREKKKRRKEASDRAANAAEARAAAAVAAAAAIKPQQPLPYLAREPSEEEEEIDIENGDPPPRERWVDPDVLAGIAASTPLSLAESDADDTKVDVESQQVEMNILDDESATTPVLQELKKDSMDSTTCETPGLNILAEAAAFAVRLPLTESCKDRIELGTGSTKQPQFEKNNLDGASLRAHHKLKRGNMPCDSCDTSRLNILAAVAASSSPLPTTKSVEEEVGAGAGSAGVYNSATSPKRQGFKTKNESGAPSRKRSHGGKSILDAHRAAVHVLDEDNVEDVATTRKRSRAGRRIVVPRRFRNEPQGRQH